MTLTKNDLGAISKVVKKQIKSSVPGIVGERINASVPGIVDERINASVPGIVDERINASVPGIVDENSKGIAQQIGKRIDEFEEELLEKIRHLPTTEKFHTENAKLAKEIQDLRDEVTASTYRSSENSDLLTKHEKRIKRLEVKVNLATS